LNVAQRRANMPGVSPGRTFSVLLALSLAACTKTPSSAPKYLSVTLALPRNADGVFLNEPLTFFFSAEIDRSSVTAESVSIRTPDNVPARGAIAVNGNSITFTPAPVLASDLSDGGYRPDTAYTVEIHGFPWVDGLRGVGGEPLRETYTFPFRTASAATPVEALLFADAEPEKTRPLAFFPPSPSIEHTIGSDDAIYLDSDKPIDPTSLRDAQFMLRKNGTNEPVRVRARLVENESEPRVRPKPRFVQSIALESFWESQPRAALIELVPLKKLAPDTVWRLHLVPDESGTGSIGPRDFTGHPVWNPALVPSIRVGFRGLYAGKGVLYEDFVTRDLIPRPCPGTDGLAHWGTTGRVEVRYPAAAGLGTSGAVALTGAVSATDLHATSLTVRAGERVNLPSERGLVVLRAQGALRIAGQVTREVARKSGESDEPLLDLYTSDDKLQRSVTLTRWLEEMRKSNRTATVLIAGGDLVIEDTGELRTNTPIVLVAGGLVSARGSVRTTRLSDVGVPIDPVFVLGDGGGDIKPPRSTASLLDMDPPCDGNPLREVLHYAVLSGPVPQRGSVAAWTSAEAGGSKIGTDKNRWSVRYVREVRGSETSIEELGPVDRPQTLEPVGSIQMLIELWVAPGPTFDPPFVDFVRLTWEQKLGAATAGGSR
jgi:hypothetical protein